jgi:hypothetical protein
MTCVTPIIGVVERAREMIAGGSVLAREDDIAMRERVGDARPPPFLFPGQIARERDGLRHIEAPAMRLARETALALGHRKRAARAGIDYAGGSVRRGETRGDVGTGAEAGIDEAARFQDFEGRGIGIETRRLAHRVAVAIDPEPIEVGQRCRDIVLARTAAVDIVDADAKAAAAAARRRMRERSAIGVAEVQLARRTGCEARQHGRAGESICCAVAFRIIPYLASDAPLTSESDAACNEGVTQGRQWRAIPRSIGGSVTKPCSIPILPGIPIPVRLSYSMQTIRR